jgi:hypothetical protein
LGETARSTALPRFLLLYAAMYAAFGVASPFLPALVNARGVPAAQLGLVLSAVAYLRAADNVSRLLPIWLRGMHQPAVSP